MLGTPKNSQQTLRFLRSFRGAPCLDAPSQTPTANKRREQAPALQIKVLNAKKILKREGRPLPYNPTRQYVRTAPYLPQRGKVSDVSAKQIYDRLRSSRMTDEVLLTIFANNK